jgi:hypothetical protein
MNIWDTLAVDIISIYAWIVNSFSSIYDLFVQDANNIHVIASGIAHKCHYTKLNTSIILLYILKLIM